MTYAQTPLVAGVKPIQKVEIHYEENHALFGLIRWWREVRREVLDEWLNIQISTIPGKVFVNGIEYVPKQ